ncbi:MAG: hypothetical protein NTW31_08800 [Bacteroidetes bacterium]|nr:hypothetical protein [Bacteroidota bacterium]
MKLPWFRQYGIFFLPTSLVGWLILISGLAYAVYIFIDIDSRSHSASDTLRPFIISLMIIVAVYSFIAWLTSRKPKTK